MIDFHDTLFLGAWEPIDHVLTSWGSPIKGNRVIIIGGVQLFLEDFADLILGEMISSEIVDSCFAIFAKKYLKNYYLDSLALLQGDQPLFPRPNNIRKKIQFTKKPVLPGALKEIEIENYDKIFIPGIFHTNHWNLFVVDLINNTITSYDSIENNNIKTSKELGSFVNFWRNKKIQFQHVQGTCLLQTGLDCGAHVILNTESLSRTGEVMQSSNLVRERVLEIIKIEMKNKNS